MENMDKYWQIILQWGYTSLFPLFALSMRELPCIDGDGDGNDDDDDNDSS